MEYTKYNSKKSLISSCFNPSTTSLDSAQRTYEIYLESELKVNIKILARLV